MLKVKLFATLLMLVPAGAGQAMGSKADGRASAEVVWAYRAKPRVVAGNQVWSCVEAMCTGRVGPAPKSVMTACRTLARAAGRVVSFLTPTGPLKAEEIAQCNRGLE